MYCVAERERIGCSTPGLYWRANIYHGMRVIDCDGKAFAVSGWHVIQPASRFRQSLARLLETAVRVHLEFEAIDPLTIDELKLKAIAEVAEDPESFEELSGKSVEWWHETLASAQRPEDLINAFLAADREG